MNYLTVKQVYGKIYVGSGDCLKRKKFYIIDDSFRNLFVFVFGQIAEGKILKLRELIHKFSFKYFFMRRRFLYQMSDYLLFNICKQWSGTAIILKINSLCLFSNENLV